MVKVGGSPASDSWENLWSPNRWHRKRHLVSKSPNREGKMSRLGIVMSTAMLMVLALQGNSVAKEKTLKQQIQGASENRSSEDTLHPAMSTFTYPGSIYGFGTRYPHRGRACPGDGLTFCSGQVEACCSNGRVLHACTGAWECP